MGRILENQPQFIFYICLRFKIETISTGRNIVIRTKDKDKKKPQAKQVSFLQHPYQNKLIMSFSAFRHVLSNLVPYYAHERH